MQYALQMNYRQDQPCNVAKLIASISILQDLGEQHRRIVSNFVKNTSDFELPALYRELFYDDD